MFARLWPRLVRYSAAVSIGAVLWCAYAAWLLLPKPVTGAQEEAIGLLLVLDVLAGVICLALLPLRLRHPVVIACLTLAVSAFSVSSTGPAAFAVVALVARRGHTVAYFLPGVCVTAAIAAEIVYLPLFTGVAPTVPTTMESILLALIVLAAEIAAGLYLGTRRALVAALRDRLRAAEYEQTLMAQAARASERARIAREMHDVLAHRISLVAMHAGALTYRADLTREQTAEAAQTIQANTQLALVELRQVLGVLQSDQDGAVEPPQPTLAELPALLADAREAGSTVTLDTTGLPGGDLPALPETLSRTVFRIVQECLTNARRHAPGQPVHVRLAGSVHSGLHLEVMNPAVLAEPALARPTTRAGVPNTVHLRLTPPTSGAAASGGAGLAGLTERAALAGGTLTHGRGPDRTFIVSASLPWPR